MSSKRESLHQTQAGPHPGISLSEVGRLHVKAFLLHQAARGLAPVTRATGLYAIRSIF